MRLTAREKDSVMFERLLKINDACFALDERASREKLLEHFRSDDIFVDYVLTPGAFAFVTERGGPYLMIIAVHESLRGMGIARRLVQEILDFYTLGSEPYIQLTCKIDNVLAQVLYLKSGFQVVRVIPKYYGETDGVMYRRILC